MKKFIVLLALISLGISCKSDKNKEAELVEKPLIAIADFNTMAGDYVGKEVQVVGIVDHLCKHGAKKILLVDDFGDLHVTSETRFEESLVGAEIIVTGIVLEFRVDEAYCLQEESDFIQNHKDGTDSDEIYAENMETVKYYRDSMKASGKDHISYYSLEYVSHEVKE